MDDELMLRRPKTPTDILRERREISLAPSRQPEFAPSEPTHNDEPEHFDPESRSYKACGRASNKTLPSIRLIFKDQAEIACCYAHLDSRHPDGCGFSPTEPGKGNVIRLRFAGAEANFTVHLEGRNLRRLWELLVGHLTPWVFEYPADLDTLAEGEPVVKTIRIEA